MVIALLKAQFFRRCLSRLPQVAYTDSCIFALNHLLLTMTTLPSFVELMSTLGLDHRDSAPKFASRSPSHSRSSSNTSTTSSPPIILNSPMSRQAHRSQSIPSFRELESDRRPGNRHRMPRYSPYSPGAVSCPIFNYSLAIL